MQPQQPASQNPTPIPPSQFDFILGNNKPKKNGLGLPSLNLPRPVKLGLIAVGFLVLLVIIGSLLFGKKTPDYSGYINVLARAQEISRVSGVAQQAATDSATQSLASTVQVATSSDETQLNAYLKAHGVKVSTKATAADQDTATDTQLQTAAQNNDLPQVYGTYLKTNLANYQSLLSTAYKTASVGAKPILNTAYNSAGVILNSKAL